jgi:hypothetical protein
MHFDTNYLANVQKSISLGKPIYISLFFRDFDALILMELYCARCEVMIEAQRYENNDEEELTGHDCQ